MSSNPGFRWFGRAARIACRLAPTALVALAFATLAGDAIAQHPNTTFNHTTEFNEITDQLWDRLLFWATVVFVIVQVGLLYIVFRFKAKPNQPNPSHVHGNTALEIAWTAIPAVILAFIAVPTVKAIFQTQAKAPANALQVEVIGHQWWWEFRYPQYGITTANELYLPTGRPVNFALKTADVLHSFWIPRLGGKRDLISNKVNYLWFTPRDSMALKALNGTCNEYCGDSHANMKFRVFTVKPEQFASWAAHQKAPAVFGAVVPKPATPAAGAAPAESVTKGGQVGPALAQGAPAAPVGFVFPQANIEAHTIPTMKAPATLTIQAGLVGDPERGRQVYSRSSCIGCHVVAGNPASAGVIGPNLTHVGSRYTIAAGLYPNTPEYLAKWIKNAPAMKPGSIMPALGKGEWNPATKSKVTLGGLTDQEIVDIAAYLSALK